MTNFEVLEHSEWESLENDPQIPISVNHGPEIKVYAV